MRLWRLTPDRAAEWLAIRLEALREEPQAYGSRLVDWQDRPLADFAARLAAARVFAAGDVEGQPLAVALWEADEDAAEDAWLMSVYARPAARRRGYAQAVIGQAAQDAAAAGIRRMRLHVGQDNTPARALYQRLGFRLVPGTAFDNGNGVTEVEMARPLPWP